MGHRCFGDRHTYGADRIGRGREKNFELLDGTIVNYYLVLPDDYTGGKPLPAILALPGADQQSHAVQWGLKHYWQTEAERRGYIVVSPQSPGQLFYEGGEKYIPEILERIKTQYKIKGDRFHLTGVSSGGMSAMQVAAVFPDYFHSVTALPGFLWVPTEKKYQTLKDKCMILIAGAPEILWADGARRDVEKLRELGASPFLDILPGKVHWRSPYIDDGAAKLFDMIEDGVGCPE